MKRLHQKFHLRFTRKEVGSGSLLDSRGVIRLFAKRNASYSHYFERDRWMYKWTMESQVQYMRWYAARQVCGGSDLEAGTDAVTIGGGDPPGGSGPMGRDRSIGDGPSGTGPSSEMVYPYTFESVPQTGRSHSETRRNQR